MVGKQLQLEADDGEVGAIELTSTFRKQKLTLTLLLGKAPFLSLQGSRYLCVGRVAS